jgi:hypothetical protein
MSGPSEAMKRVVMLAARLDAKPALYPDHSPHPNARTLTMPDGTTAPDVIRAWAGFDVRYPWPQASKRSTQEIASAEGVVNSKPMNEVLDGALAKEHEGGYGVVLEGGEGPQRVLWFPKEGDPVCLFVESGKVDKREPFDAWLTSLFTE